MFLGLLLGRENGDMVRARCPEGSRYRFYSIMMVDIQPLVSSMAFKVSTHYTYTLSCIFHDIIKISIRKETRRYYITIIVLY